MGWMGCYTQRSPYGEYRSRPIHWDPQSLEKDGKMRWAIEEEDEAEVDSKIPTNQVGPYFENW